MNSLDAKRLSSIVRVTLAFALTASASAGHAATVYNEVGNAGQLLGTSQVISGSGALDAIRGSLLNTSASDYADVFGIFLTAGQSFSATTTASSLAYNSFDTSLFLFSSAGLGLFANDDAPGPQSTISGFTPTFSGIYYLAIAGAGYTPISAGGAIFPSLSAGGQFGPTGPGGAQALSGWNSITSEGDVYEIQLTGAQFVNAVPEPSAWLMMAFGLAAIGAAGSRKARSAAT